MSQAAPYQSRSRAGVLLAAAVRQALPEVADPIVLALPRGGVPVGLEVSRTLEAPLDVLVVRKLVVPNRPDVTVGAVASGGGRVLDAEAVSRVRLDGRTLAEMEVRERAEILRLENAYRGLRGRLRLRGRSVILVDDGVETGSSMLSAVQAVRALEPERVVVAVPVASPDTVPILRRDADLVVCLLQPVPFFAIGVWYLDYPQLWDEEVRALLERAWAEEARPRGAPRPR
jgi:putative phosphoribosyl transferase